MTALRPSARETASGRLPCDHPAPVYDLHPESDDLPVVYDLDERLAGGIARWSGHLGISRWQDPGRVAVSRCERLSAGAASGNLRDELAPVVGRHEVTGRHVTVMSGFQPLARAALGSLVRVVVPATGQPLRRGR